MTENLTYGEIEASTVRRVTPRELRLAPEYYSAGRGRVRAVTQAHNILFEDMFGADAGTSSRRMPDLDPTSSATSISMSRRGESRTHPWSARERPVHRPLTVSEALYARELVAEGISPIAFQAPRTRTVKARARTKADDERGTGATISCCSSWRAAFNAHDLDKIMGHFAEDASLDMPRGSQAVGYSLHRKGCRAEGVGDEIRNDS